MAKAEIVPLEKRQSLIEFMAEKYAMMPDEFKNVIKATCFNQLKEKITDEMLLTFLAVAKEYGLNPLMREIYAFPRPGGGIQVIVSVDGWSNIVNSNPAYDGDEFIDKLVGDQLISTTCRVYRKDRSRPSEAIEYMKECRRNTDVWRQWPNRMLHHKAFEQACRKAFGLAGIVTPDEAERAFDKERPITVVVDTPISAIADSLPDNAPHVDTDSGRSDPAPASPDPDQPIGNDGGQELQDSADRLGLTIKQQMTLLKKYNITGYDELPLGQMEQFIKDMQILNVMGSKQ